MERLSGAAPRIMVPTEIIMTEIIMKEAVTVKINSVGILDLIAGDTLVIATREVLIMTGVPHPAITEGTI